MRVFFIFLLGDKKELIITSSALGLRKNPEFIRYHHWGHNDHVSSFTDPTIIKFIHVILIIKTNK